ncbi:hypothetical protein GGQ92_001071 [Gracilibacillus halotolerans]|uniref:DUF115 domain-containing protein n=1 Tax=Gracilibacillus halotolerans TaxID=74386 RepID=A0A841RE63_9BACI|nr:6-hydroxymethylpterin diphosphokinase MptE-like protein [Gracilibacillus halotolerans]MBB6512290.1 hypothetical protein [Gracilibacillus halotolerans]
MLIENRNYLRVHDRELLYEIDNNSIEEGQVIIEPSKAGAPTLKVTVENTVKYMHSKYDPEVEAERFINKFELKQDTKHIFLVGFGLGYHIKYLKEKYPYLSFTIYEPEFEVLVKMLETVKVNKLFNGINVQIIRKDSLRIRTAMLYENYGDKIQILTLPFYERYYSLELQGLYEILLNNLKEKKGSLVLGLTYQKRWTLNAIKNFPTIIKTPNILHDIDHSQFQDKPAIIVAAGPSLNEEFENLRYIKDHGLAYIFSVGSAVNSLIDKNIYPDATLSFDPKKENAQILQKIKDKRIDNIPLIFGSTVGFETLYDYAGPMLYMVTSQDTITPRLLPDGEKIRIVADASSIALVTYQLLVNIGFKTIYLVGQNLAFKNKSRYAEGIKNYNSDKADEDKLFPIKGVHGEEVYTDDNYDRMRKQFENYIEVTTPLGIKVYNTTKNGAAIKGAPFITLEKVIKNHLKSTNLVMDKWFEGSPSYDVQLVIQEVEKLALAKDTLADLLTDLNIFLNKIITSGRNTQIERQFANFDKRFKKVRRNAFYLAFIAPMIRVQTEKLVKISKDIKTESDQTKKKELFEKSFGDFLLQITELNDELEIHFNELQENIK